LLNNIEFIDGGKAPLWLYKLGEHFTWLN
jgi:hypothetical protein